MNYHFKVIGTAGDVVKATSQLSGTHGASFDLTGINMGEIPAAGKTPAATLEKTRITAWVVEPTQGAGVTAIHTAITN